MKKGITIGFITGFSVAIMLVVYFAFKQSSKVSSEIEMRDAYYPNTEELAPDEMRVVALGTGMPI
jgi:ribonuclease Z